MLPVMSVTGDVAYIRGISLLGHSLEREMQTTQMRESSLSPIWSDFKI